MEELLGCAFCGGEARLKNPMSKYACCSNSECAIYGVWIDIEIWNTRHFDVEGIIGDISTDRQGNTHIGIVEKTLKKHLGKGE